MTAAQLTILAYGHPRIAQRRLSRLWELGLLERTTLPPVRGRGGAPHAYRLTRAARDRLGQPGPRPHGAAYLRHTLDAVETVCRLVASSRDGDPIVEAWLPESLARGLLRPDVRPDAILVLRGSAGAAVVCLEMDEGTQHQAVIRAKLAAYSKALVPHPTWLLLVIVTNDTRLAWLRRTAGIDQHAGPWAWATTLAELRSGLAATMMPLPIGARHPLENILTDQREHALHPIGSKRWLQLLGDGGAERIDLA